MIDQSIIATYEEPEGLEVLDSELGEYPIDSVLIRPENRTIFEVARRMKNDIYILDPDFQRDFVWSQDKQSKLIESTLMRIPLPVFYLAEQGDGRIVVVDGLQRLTTFQRFLNNGFVLRGLNGTSAELNGKTFKDLPAKFQTRIEDTNLILYLIDAKVPERARLDIFDRVNSGVPLSRQQMRNCLYVGDATRWLKGQARSSAFLTATGGSLNPATMRDREAINRFCGFYLSGVQGYVSIKGDMDQFLAETLKRMNTMGQPSLNHLAQIFERSMRINHLVFGRLAFRKHTMPEQGRNVINIALFDVFSVLMANIDESFVQDQGEVIRERFYALMQSEEFKRAITLSTNSVRNVLERFHIATEQFPEFPYADQGNAGAF